MPFDMKEANHSMMKKLYVSILNFIGPQTKCLCMSYAFIAHVELFQVELTEVPMSGYSWLICCLGGFDYFSDVIFLHAYYHRSIGFYFSFHSWTTTAFMSVPNHLGGPSQSLVNSLEFVLASTLHQKSLLFLLVRPI